MPEVNIAQFCPGDAIRAFRIRAGFTQKELGERSGIAESTIRQYERGSLNPKIETLAKILGVFGIFVTIKFEYERMEQNRPLELYDNIRAKRELLGLTQTELAKLTGYSDRSMISKIESGEVDLSIGKLLVFADALRTTPIALTGWREEAAK